MADNVTFQTTVATPPDATAVATDDVGGVHYQRIKVDLGGDGLASPLVRGQQADASSIPVTLSTELAAVLAAIKTAVEALDNIVAGSEAQVDIVTSALPTGASTAAKQPALGTAGTASADVITVQGVTSMTPLLVNGSGVTQPVSGTVTANAGTGPFPVSDNAGSLTVDAPVATPVFVRLSDGSAAIATLPVSAASLPLPTGASTLTEQQTQSTALSAIQTAVQVLDNAISGNEMQVDVVAALPAGTNLIGDVGIQGRATGGTSTFRSIDLDETEEEVKATAGTIYSIAAFNRTAAPLYLKLYNLTAANTTVGTSTPTHTYVVPANADSDGAGFILNVPQGIAFSTAISAAVTTGVADADTGAPGANDVVVNIQYV